MKDKEELAISMAAQMVVDYGYDFHTVMSLCEIRGGSGVFRQKVNEEIKKLRFKRSREKTRIDWKAWELRKVMRENGYDL